MARNYLPLLVLLIALAAIFQDDFSFTLLYLFAGAYGIGLWWSRRSLASLQYKRKFNRYAFLGETVKVVLEIRNAGWLPIPWVRIHEGLPVELSGPDSFQRVTTISARDHKSFEYEFNARRRGYYPIGPVFFTTSDVLGLSTLDFRREGEAEYLTVYPKIIPLTNIAFQSKSPMGTLRHHQPIFEDPTRVMGKRDYVAGDSLRRVDWKSTAVTGRMQVKIFEPSIALETVIFLNLNNDDYHYKSRIASTELAIVIAASMANWVVGKQQTVGFCTNGDDPNDPGGESHFLPARPGRGHLVKLLELLARIKVENRPNFEECIRRKRIHLPWGTTLTIITGNADKQLLDELYQARRSGLNANMILTGPVSNASDICHKAEFFGIPVLNITKESDMDVWRV